ncbi:hypothetical protein SATRM34S_00110 [Streptomyces atroolivaceus]
MRTGGDQPAARSGGFPPFRPPRPVRLNTAKRSPLRPSPQAERLLQARLAATLPDHAAHRTGDARHRAWPRPGSARYGSTTPDRTPDRARPPAQTRTRPGALVLTRTKEPPPWPRLLPRRCPVSRSLGALAEAAQAAAAMSVRLILTIADVACRAAQKHHDGKEKELGSDAEKLAEDWSAEQLRTACPRASCMVCWPMPTGRASVAGRVGVGMGGRRRRRPTPCPYSSSSPPEELSRTTLPTTSPDATSSPWSTSSTPTEPPPS